MESRNTPYSLEDSISRIDEVLDNSDSRFEELKEIPGRDRLTYTNGFYVDCACVFVDIRSSSQLPNKYRRPTLGKIYRSYISEAVAVLNSSPSSREVNIHGDAVWAVFNTPYKRDVDDAFNRAAMLASVVDILNYRFEKKARTIDPLSVGIGIDYGRALMLKAGYKGSGLNDVVWMGDVVNQASNLCGFGNATFLDSRVMVSANIYENLNDHNRGLLSWNATRQCYHANVVDVAMNEWLQKQRAQDAARMNSHAYGTLPLTYRPRY